MKFLLNLIFSATGAAYIIYGRRQFSTEFLVAGAVLALYPYFVDNLFLYFVIGAVAASAPWVVARMGL